MAFTLVSPESARSPSNFKLSVQIFRNFTGSGDRYRVTTRLKILYKVSKKLSTFFCVLRKAEVSFRLTKKL